MIKKRIMEGGLAKNEKWRRFPLCSLFDLWSADDSPLASAAQRENDPTHTEIGRASCRERV